MISLRGVSTDAPWLIPRTIHHVWLGGKLPRPFARLRDTWRLRHEGWELRLWTEADIEAFGLENKEAYDAARNFGEKSDILRYEVLLRHGGLYVDVDFLCLGAFDDLHRCYEFYAGVSNTGTFELNNGLVGCRPDHPIMRNLITKIRESWSPPPSICEERSCEGGPRWSNIGSSTSVLVTGPVVGETTPLAGAEGVRVSSFPGASPATDRDAVIEGREAGMKTGAGDPLAALIGGFGDGARRVRGSKEDDMKGLLEGLLGDEDRARLVEAVTVPPETAMATIAKTGPGAFTAAVMECMGGVTTASADVTRASFAEDFDDGDRTTGRSYGSRAVVLPGDAGKGRGEEPEPAVVMVFPPTYFYPVPNDVEGDLVGDGSERGVIDRAGLYFARESLAAHLWAKSWQ